MVIDSGKWGEARTKGESDTSLTRLWYHIYIYNDNNVIVVQEAHLNNGCLFIFIEDLQSYKYKYKTLQTLESKC